MVLSSQQQQQQQQQQQDRNEAQDIDTEFHVPRMPYNEDTIVNLISDIYRIYLLLNYISDWEVSWAPQPDGHTINETLCEELHLDPVVISLMKRLPYFRFSGITADIEFIYPYSRAFVYLEDYEIRGGRDPDRFSYEDPRPDFLLAHEIALTCSMDEGVHLILDTKENAIRVWSFSEAPPGDDIDNYRKYYPHHAPTYLSSFIQQLRSLEIIPSVSRYPRQLYNKHYPDIYPKLKKILQEQYGWPYDFQQAQWKASPSMVLKQIDPDSPEWRRVRDYSEPDDLKDGIVHSSWYLWKGG